MAIKLHSITLSGMRVINGLRLESFELDRPSPNLRDWRVVLRGPTVLLISPPGWTSSGRDPKSGQVVTVELPRSEVIIQWRGDESDADAIAKCITKYESGPLGFKPTPVVEGEPILAQIPSHQVGD